PEGLAGFAEAIARIAGAITRGERIGVFGDYDVDGVTTCALLTQFLRAAGAAVEPRVARRDGGYGFTTEVAAELCDAGCGLIVTGDCGTSDLPAIAVARARGIDVVVIDHHTVPDASVAHPAVALVNPLREDSTFPFRGLASVGLAFYVVAAVRTRLTEEGYFRERGGRDVPDVRELLDLVALGTIADLVPLTAENRILVTAGLRQLATRPRPGIAALAATAGIDPSRPLDEKSVSWKLAPRLNAPGRLGSAAPSLELLLADDTSALACATAVEEANTARRAAQDVVYEGALAELETIGADEPAVVIARRGWLPGVVGIVAAKLVERTGRPAFVIAIDDDGVGRGSARTAGGIDLYRALAGCAPLLERFGGHAAAAGLTVREAQVAELRAALGIEVTRLAAGSGPVAAPVADAEVGLAELDERLVTELVGLGPFGQANAAPRLVARGVRVRASRRVGDGSHLKLDVVDARTGVSRGAIGFGFGDRDPGIGAIVDLAFTPTVSEWNGSRRVELELTALEPVG
ncbi:MAG: single-stranded-DNA-specific exonuclease RecJ, partial [Deltaproteobacteria bacterium]|nr:single-stranded-DNA-specific exonuclease RecJ [Deltaproteobacteria bacterium]